MQTWIALLRGINVGGRNKMPMAELRAGLEAAGFCSVRSYIQSGNVVFDATPTSKYALAKRLDEAIERRFGFLPEIFLLTTTDFQAAIDNNPFPDAVSEPKTLHFYFLECVPNSPDVDSINNMVTSTERYELIDTIFYLHAPDGVGRSKLASSVERRLGVSATARNYKTIQALSTMLRHKGDLD